MLRRVMLAASLALAAIGATSSRRAAPWIVLVYGNLLPERRALVSWEENQKLLASLGPETVLPPGTARGGERRGLELALFWGWQWKATAGAPASVRALRPEQANQRGWYYPAKDQAPAVMTLGSGFRVVGDSGLAVLRRHGIPTRVR
ncbi:hypothetical protein J421_0613 [Gemmatirosa kalamazoonensis]|uniref:AIG2 family protein n=1 Tax=Gemmatirosa kalamazoonensis TaxID=861299 RepID=W0RCU9_9BACT|nr:hypothetical protein [Gemmatirosa kalamazoonensis]AHG88150.1 hypothetical protein J421_0613 [Gemmatirosa kalamazoonensis]